MRNFLILLMFFTFNELISQEIESEDSECKKGEEQALIDFYNGIYWRVYNRRCGGAKSADSR